MSAVLKRVFSFTTFLFLTFLIIPNKVYAQDNFDYGYDYTITNYDINVVVNENNTYNIVENIDAYFLVDKHGIFRKIPLSNKVYRLDGTTSVNRAKISDITVSDNYSSYNESGYKVIKIGDENKTLSGLKSYTISYLYDLGKDKSRDYDEVYLNLIGAQWDTVITNATFSITMPKEFDASKLGFSKGKFGSTDSSNIDYEVNGNVVTGKLNDILMPGEALAFRLELDDGYFVGASDSFSLTMVLAFILPILFVVISYFIWRKYGKDDKVVETVEFYPPNGFNSLEVGFLYKGKADSQDVTSLLIYLANKGYIKISEYEEKSLFSTVNSFKIIKLKEYDGNNINERIFLNGLFEKRPTLSILNDNKEQEINDNEVTSSDLYNSFYITTKQILSNINSKENKNKIFEKKSSSKNIFIVLMIILTFILITAPPLYAYGVIETLPIAIIFPAVGFTVMFSVLFGKSSKTTVSSIIFKLFGVIWGFMFGGSVWISLILPTLLADPIYLFIYIVGIICVLLMVICLKYLPKRTVYGNEILGKISGFRNFLETVEKDKLETLVMENPTYFYDILPFTYVLGVSDKWISKFETISMSAPSWYDSDTVFNVVVFNSFINNTMTSAQRVMSSSPSSSSSTSSGGGFSGGGSGGGGGGSW